jgi:hypothetical protein
MRQNANEATETFLLLNAKSIFIAILLVSFLCFFFLNFIIEISGTEVTLEWNEVTKERKDYCSVTSSHYLVALCVSPSLTLLFFLFSLNRVPPEMKAS